MIDDGRHGEQQTNTTTRDWGVMMGEWDWGVVEPKSVFSDGMTDLPLVVDIQARDPSTILLQAPHLCTTQAEPISSIRLSSIRLAVPLCLFQVEASLDSENMTKTMTSLHIEHFRVEVKPGPYASLRAPARQPSSALASERGSNDDRAFSFETKHTLFCPALLVFPPYPPLHHHEGFPRARPDGCIRLCLQPVGNHHPSVHLALCRHHGSDQGTS